MTPELRLLAACLAWPPSEQRIAAVTAAAAAPDLDWNRFAEAVDRHRAAAFAHDGLTRARIETAPASFRAALERRAAADGLMTLVFVRETARLARALRSAGIEVLLLKGPGLMQLAYGDLAIRHGRDLDLMVRAEDIVRAGEICEAAGYRRILPAPGAGPVELAEWLRWRKDFAYRHGRDDIVLELHYRPTLSPLQSDRLDLWGGRTEVTLPGGVTAQAPAGAALYAYLCLHGALCAWFRMKWLADIAALTAALSDHELAALHEAATARGAGRASGQALLLVETVFGRALPPMLRERIVADRHSRRLAAMALTVMSDPREPQEVPLRPARIELAQLALTDDWRVRLQALRGWLIDWPLVFALPLPRPLWFLYPILRGPAWLARRLGWRRPAPVSAPPRPA